MPSTFPRVRGHELWLFAALALFAFAPQLSLIGGGGVYNGASGLNASDHLQYLGMIRDAGEHTLISNLFDVVDDPNLFLHPTFFLSGVAWQIGLGIEYTLLIWKPLALIALFVGFAAYVRRLLVPDGAAMAVALAVALFYLAPAAYLADWLGASAGLEFGSQIIGFEMYAAMYTWVGATGALSIALMPLFLLGVERLLDPGRRREGRSTRWYAAWTGLAGMLCSWLHPWQGITLLVILAALALWERSDPRRLSVLVVPAALTLAPLAYLWALGQTDSSWSYVSQANDLDHISSWLFLGLAPAVLAIPGYRGRDLDVQERILRIWPLAALAVYFALQSSWFYHAFDGLTLPLAILAVRGLRGLRLPRLAVVGCLLAFTVPGAVYVLAELRDQRGAHFMTADERDALRYLEERDRPGVVLAPRVPLGEAVPGFTGRNTYVGHYTWTPDYEARSAGATALFEGELAPADARRLVLDSSAAFLLSDCGGRVDLRPLLPTLIAGVRRFGCATVYEVRRQS